MFPSGTVPRGAPTPAANARLPSLESLMPSLNLDALNWTRWLAEDPKPEWPTWLTKEHWNKKKSLTSNAIETGIGAQLVVTKKAFDDAVKGAPVFRPRNIDEMDSSTESSVRFTQGSALKKLRTELQDLERIALAAVAAYKKSKHINLKSTTQLAQDIATAADLLKVACNVNTLGGQLSDLVEQETNNIHEASRKRVGPTIAAAIKVPAKVLKEIKTLQHNLDAMVVREAEGFGDLEGEDLKEAEALLAQAWKAVRANIGASLFTCARDMTQPLANLRKARQAGVRLRGITDRQLADLLKDLVPYGNGNAATVTSDDPEAIEKKLNDVRDAARTFKTYVDDLAVETD